MKSQPSIRFFCFFLVLLPCMAAWSTPLDAGQYQCEPTVEDEMGPFYRPDAPLRNRVGSGYLLVGTVKSAQDCGAIAGARIELWMAGPGGHYGDPWRATLFSGENGRYYFESHAATDYLNRPPHVHIRVTAHGFADLVTQHYPVAGAGEGLFDLVLVEAKR